MSAPDTDLDTQKRRHIGPLAGIALSVLVAGLLLVGYLGILAARGDAPEGAATQIDGRLGTEIEN